MTGYKVALWPFRPKILKNIKLINIKQENIKLIQKYEIQCKINSTITDKNDRLQSSLVAF